MRNLKLFLAIFVAVLSLASTAAGATAPAALHPDVIAFIVAVQTNNLEEAQICLGRPDIYNTVIETSEETAVHALEIAIKVAVHKCDPSFISEIIEAILAIPSFENLERYNHSGRYIVLMFTLAIQNDQPLLMEYLKPKITIIELQQVLKTMMLEKFFDITCSQSALFMTEEIKHRARENPDDETTQEVFHWLMDIEEAGKPSPEKAPSCKSFSGT